MESRLLPPFRLIRVMLSDPFNTLLFNSASCFCFQYEQENDSCKLVPVCGIIFPVGDFSGKFIFSVRCSHSRAGDTPKLQMFGHSSTAQELLKGKERTFPQQEICHLKSLVYFDSSSSPFEMSLHTYEDWKFKQCS